MIDQASGQDDYYKEYIPKQAEAEIEKNNYRHRYDAIIIDEV